MLSATPISITGGVEIEIAGVKRQYMVTYQISADSVKTIHLHGTQHLNFSDFKLAPPRKLGGMIKTRDQLTVDFQLKMKTI